MLIYVFVRFITFNACGRDYDAAIIAVGHTGFGLGAVPVSMATMSSVCEEYRYSKLAYFVVPPAVVLAANGCGSTRMHPAAKQPPGHCGEQTNLTQGGPHGPVYPWH